MNQYLQTWQGQGTEGTDAQMVAALRRTLDANYQRILASAAEKWERRFGGGRDPSDRCVRVRISSAGYVGDRRPLRLSGAGRHQ